MVDRDRALLRKLERVYARYHRPEFIEPDPLQFVLLHEDPQDREIVALVASSLAFGRVRSIVRSVGDLLSRLGPHPARWLMGVRRTRLHRTLEGFRHRWVTGDQVASLLWAARTIVRREGSLGRLVVASGSGRETHLEALLGLAARLRALSKDECGFLVARPTSGCPHKRLNLMARWMVRQDVVDPGGWRGISPAGLVVPLDVHMHRLGVRLRFTQRRRPDLTAALEVTRGFRKLQPEDPVRYDFSLTRAALRGLDPLRPLDPSA